MAVPPGDKRPPLAVAVELASQATSIAVLMVLPAAAGYWVDQKLGTFPWLLIAGAGFGFAAGTMQLVRLVGGAGRKGPRRKGDH